jgi:hypothetical protein
MITECLNQIWGVFKLNNTLDLLNITLVSINIASAVYYKVLLFKVRKIKEIVLINAKDRRVIDTLLAIELLFFAASYVFLGTGKNDAFGGITDPSLVLYTVAELCKGVGFMTYIFITITDFKKELKKYSKVGVKLNGCNC